MKYINWEKIKENVNTSTFVMATTMIIGFAALPVIVIAASNASKEQVELQKYVEGVEYVVEDQQFTLSELYVVEKDDHKYLCFMGIAGLKGIGPLEQRYAKEVMGWNVPITLRGKYSYYDVKTKEEICSSDDNNVIISELVDDLIDEIDDKKIKKEEINQEYIDSQFNHKVK